MAQDPLRSGVIGRHEGYSFVYELASMYTLDTLMHTIRQLPYEDLRQLGRMIDNELVTSEQHKDAAVALADVIARVAASAKLEEKAVDQTEATLRRAIRRKSNLTITPEKKGWTVATKDATVVCDDLKQGVAQLLDQIAVVHIMRNT